MRNILFLIMVALSLLLAFYFFNRQAESQQKVVALQEQLAEAQNRLQAQQRVADSLRQHSPAPDSSRLSAAVLATGAMLAQERLRAAGFSDPEAELLKSLQGQPELIPRTGTMGGTMAYRQLTLLSPNFAIAYLEDGHHAGYSLLRYKAAAPGKIEWKLLDHHDM